MAVSGLFGRSEMISARELEGLSGETEGPIQGHVSLRSTPRDCHASLPLAGRLDGRLEVLEEDTPLWTQISCAALKALVSEAAREAVRDEFLAFRGSGDQQQARADGTGRPVYMYKPCGPSAPAEHADEQAGLEAGREQLVTSSVRAGSKGTQKGPDGTQATPGQPSSLMRQGSVRGAFKRMLKKKVTSPRLDDKVKELDEQEREVLTSFKFDGLGSNSCAEKVTACLIFINAVTIGFQSDMFLRGDVELGKQLQYLNWAMVFLFVIELAVRMVHGGRDFFRKRNLAWNTFDLLTVTSSALDVVLQVSSSSFQIEQVSYLRIIRILRVFNAFRIIRILPFFRELRVMVAGVLNCTKPLMWAVALMFLVSYMFATMVAQACVEDAQLLHGVVDCRYGTLLEIMFILFQATTGGMDWGELAAYLHQLSLILVVGLCLYILVVMLVIVNVITAVFVEAALEQKQDPEELLVDTIQRKRKWLLDVKKFFETCEKDPQGAMSVEQLVRVLDQNNARSSLTTLGVDAQFVDWSTLHAILDENNDGKVTLEEFANCLQGMRGLARSSDVMVLRHDIKKLLREGTSAMA